MNMETEEKKKNKIRSRRNSITNLKDVIQSLVRVKRQPTGINAVHTCPKNIQEVREARTRMGCERDRYGRNQYMCIPNKELTGLMEFCFPGVMGLREKSHCLVVSGDKKVTARSCREFKYGCPDTHYNQVMAYTNHECQKINTEYRCYLEHPLCPPLNGTDLAGDTEKSEKYKMFLMGLLIKTTPKAPDARDSKKQKTTTPLLSYTESMPTSMDENAFTPNWVFKVKACPESEEEVSAAQQRTRCGHDTYGKSQYMCIPDHDLSVLSEFCHLGIVGLQEKGTCPVLSGKNSITTRTCKDFNSGCPKRPYHSNEAYKHPACQKIDTKRRCYIEDPSCSKSMGEDLTLLTTSSPYPQNISTTMKMLPASLVVPILSTRSAPSEATGINPEISRLYNRISTTPQSNVNMNTETSLTDRSFTTGEFTTPGTTIHWNRENDTNTTTTTSRPPVTMMGCAACLDPFGWFVVFIFVAGILIFLLVKYCLRKKQERAQATRNGEERDWLNRTDRDT